MTKCVTHPVRRLRRRGFSLVEVMVALSLGVIVLAAATSGVVQMMRAVNATERRALVDEDARMLVDYLLTRFEGIGGGNVRPWMAYGVEDACAARNGLPACNNSDRITIATNISGSTCSIANMPAWVNASTAFTISCNAPSNVCPFTASAVHKQAIWTNAAGNYRQLVITAVGAAASNLCAITAKTGQGPASMASATAVDGTSATLNLVNLTTFYVDTTAHELRAFVDADDDASLDAGESSLLDDRVYDLQVAVGYDVTTQDGVITDAASTSDEWLGNAASDAVSSAVVSDVRELRVGLILGASALDRADTAQVLNGPIRSVPSTSLKAASAEGGLRNLFLFF